MSYLKRILSRDNTGPHREGRLVTAIYTIGHSSHTIERLAALLQQHGVTAVADVRSQPYSRLHPQFNREELCTALKAVGISYVFLGKELGGRASDPSCYVDGQVQYDRVAKSPAFEAGMERLQRGGDTYRVALLCAEKDPLTCHRTLLVARELWKRGVAVQHILEPGRSRGKPRPMPGCCARCGSAREICSAPPTTSSRMPIACAPTPWLFARGAGWRAGQGRKAMNLFTLGFTKKSAEEFFGRLKRSGASRLVDVRLNNVSQLAG